ncbi:MAG: type IX secretion system membrane protein PorP/SprF [Runella slithyformis]|nr:MAG: type IX secretion system membrane protein PorP/SprF [Runella slithyformis]TAF97897.1 MAG: type IX secretion system membrane protein PorP/SprF [Runella sp.]TAG22906.1 MAG: type IX secretion system membrane protein PorP/SprF [Cytophagales bacterium]TAG41961.1 MAG: type IX secretion system membrane protein PorP/SprF [Cytophagia bacterium]TAF25475.1 MAG: type IX secretion system membrane protein PorP/SprF [Runella slithyformis]
MRFALLLILSGFCWPKICAQQLPQYAQYAQNHFLINPALAGLENYADARTGFRRQWAGVTGAPTTFYVTAHVPVGNDEFVIEPASTRFSYGRRRREPTLPDPHAGVGVTMVRDQAGPWTSLTANVAVAYHYPLNDEWQLSGGLSGGITQHSLDFDRIVLAQSQDPAVGQGKLNSTRPNLHAGVWLYSSQLYAGLSVQQLWPSRLRFRTDYDWQGKLIPHYFLTVGYRLALTEDWEFVPSFLLKKTGNTPLSVDLNLKMNHLNNVWVGLSYRHRDALVAWAGARVAQKMTVSYAYEYALSVLRPSTSGTHELTLGITLGNRDHYASPRYFW